MTEKDAKILSAGQGLLAALDFYANPDSYFAVAVIGDSPCGDFIRDAAPLTDDDQDYFEDYRRDGGGYYGKMAREALAAWRKAHEEGENNGQS